MESTNQEPEDQSTIFTEQELKPIEYFKSIKHARNAMYVLCASFIFMGVVFFFQSTDIYESVGGAGVALLVAIAFFSLARYSFKRPHISVVTSIVLYIALVLLDLFDDPATAIKGLLFKGIVLFYLFKAINDAKEHEAAIKSYEAGGLKF